MNHIKDLCNENITGPGYRFHLVMPFFLRILLPVLNSIELVQKFRKMFTGHFEITEKPVEILYQ